MHDKRWGFSGRSFKLWGFCISEVIRGESSYISIKPFSEVSGGTALGLVISEVRGKFSV